MNCIVFPPPSKPVLSRPFGGVPAKAEGKTRGKASDALAIIQAYFERRPLSRQTFALAKVNLNYFTKKWRNGH